MLLHLTGVAAGFAGLLIGLRRSIGDVEKVRMLCGVLDFKRRFGVPPNTGGWQEWSKRSHNANLFLYLYSSIGNDIPQKRVSESLRDSSFVVLFYFSRRN